MPINLSQLRRLHGSRAGFTLIELLIVLLIVSTLALVAIPPFMEGIRRATFKNKVYSVIELFEEARVQALASEVSATDRKIAVGGYGVQIFFGDPLDDNPTQTATLFIDDWNETEMAAVKLDYTDIASRVLPDGVFTLGSDTVIRTTVIDTQNYIELSELSARQSDGTTWTAASGDTLTVILTPPYAETTITGSGGVDSQEFDMVFNLKTDPLIGTLHLNRVTTTPDITFSAAP